MRTLKLGKETGSAINWIMSGAAVPETPAIGMGATILCWTDRHAGTIVKVTPTQIHVQHDSAKRIDTNGMSECQDYEYTPNPKAPIEVFRRTKRGYRNASGNALLIGKRDEYYDFSF